MTINYRIKTFLKKIFHSFFTFLEEFYPSKKINFKYSSRKDYYLPKHVVPKLLTPNVESLYNIKIEKKRPVITAETKEDLMLDFTIDRMDLQIQIYLIDFIILILNLTKNYSYKFKLNLKIYFDTNNFSNATKTIVLKHDVDTEKMLVIKAILEFIHELNEIYTITFLKKIQIQTTYEPSKK